MASARQNKIATIVNKQQKGTIIDKIVTIINETNKYDSSNSKSSNCSSDISRNDTSSSKHDRNSSTIK